MRRLFTAVGFALALLAGPAFAKAIAWPQATSDVTADPRVRFGVLANGLRYAVMRNATPPGQVSVRLRIGSGSFEETDDEQGLAHVLEHMAFKGSTHVPPGEMIKLLQRDGLAFGPDTNASTGWTATIYQLDLPRPDLIDTGLMLMRETASELLILPDKLASERGVVLSEERLRDTPEYRAFKAQADLLAHGQRLNERFPIGQVDIIKHAPASLVRKFYEANYRPDRATLVVVGDIDPAVVEAKIKARFADWKTVGPETAEPDLGQVEKRGLTVRVVQLPGANTLTYIAWARPYDASPDTLAKRRRDLIENLALAVLNRRLSKLALGGQPPFIQADSSFDNLLHSTKVAIVEAVSSPGAWGPALDAIEQETRRLVKFGVSQAEIDREIAASRAVLVNAVAGEATRETPALASGIVDSVDADQVFTDPAEDLKIYDEAVKGVTPAEVDAAVKAVFAGSGPLVEVQNPTAIAGGEAAVAKAYDQSAATPVSAPAAETAVSWPYASFGTPGKVVERRVLADLGVVQAKFANGVTVSVKQTPYRKDQILVGVNIGRGREDLPADRPAADWAAPALVEGGFGKISYEDSQRVLAGHIYDAGFDEGDNAFVLHGATRPADLAIQLQVLAAYVADPGFRPDAFERVRRTWLTFLPQMAATPGGVMRRDFEALTHDGDPRWATPTAAQLEAGKPGDLKALLGPILARSPIEITIVGDVSPDEAIGQVAATFGALPPREAASPAPDSETRVRFPAPNAQPLTLTDSGRPDQAMAIVAWPVTDFFADMQASRADMLAGAVLENRVLDKIRIDQGATYTPQSLVSLSEVFPGYGLGFVAVETPPARIPGFFADVDAIVADMAGHGVSADELARARNPRVAGIAKAQDTNEYWALRLAGSIADPRRLEIIRSTLPDYARVTPADIQAAATRWFRPETAWRLVIRQGT